VGPHAFGDVAVVGKYDTDQQGQAGHDPQCDQELDKTGHSGVSGADSTAYLRCEPRIVTGFLACAQPNACTGARLNGILTSAPGANAHGTRIPALPAAMPAGHSRTSAKNPYASVGKDDRTVAAGPRHRRPAPAPGCARGAARHARAGQRAQTSCSSKALSTARVRSRTPSLLRMLDTWFLIVPSDRKSTRLNS